ncbi:TetR/AcrR family transcriptional regulator [Chitinophagaceae bacterium LB-8]|uniref:TetR/AcrR family transcriptional regulator n=1 Tax=Paraflavisolibacter caeni TaxID=2982496 RepID=A0A9X2XV07_9BACT|nr:TetR/AcrR family transcriptional regulator [Paraflavisolibacter caeni]MCU7549799.1 TetR/AcrR family transcriptional regulator [Paraflavisolibacter caeni]
MPVKDCKTEQHIKETARRIFLKEGKMLATTQEIADAAGVNRTLLHYYFRSRDMLFNVVFTEALTKLRERLHEVIGSQLGFRQKVEKLLDVFFEDLTELPYLETFITLQLNQEPHKYEEMFVHLPGGKERIRNFLKEIHHEMEKGTIPVMKPINYMMNIFALIAYPYVAKPVFKNMFDLSDTAYNKLLLDRKEMILSLLFN